MLLLAKVAIEQRTLDNVLDACTIVLVSVMLGVLDIKLSTGIALRSLEGIGVDSIVGSFGDRIALEVLRSIMVDYVAYAVGRLVLTKVGRVIIVIALLPLLEHAGKGSF